MQLLYILQLFKKSSNFLELKKDKESDDESR